MQRHEHDLRLIVVDLVRVRDEADGLEELVGALVLARVADQLGEVLQPPLRLDAAVGF